MRKNKPKPKYQREEIMFDDFVSFMPEIKLTEKQEKLIEIIKKNKITIITGCSGTSKTFSACYAAIQLLRKKVVKKIILCKPTVIVSGSVDLGALPGSMDEKTNVYAESFYQNFIEIVGMKDFKMLIESKVIEFKPVQYSRGLSFKNSIAIFDEIQNFHINELYTLVTRLGTNSKMIFAGDTLQNDIKSKFVALDTFKELLKGLKGVSLFEFERSDIMRDKILIEITDRYEKMLIDGILPDAKNL
jgi:phosphate starvation-inducible PhoH-like protein